MNACPGYVQGVGVRAAGPDDFEEVVARFRRLPLSAVTRWALAPAPDLVEAHLAYSRWLVAGLLRIGRIWLGDDGTIAGGRRLRVQLSDQLRAQPPEHRDVGVRRRGFSYPDVPAACQQRLRDVSVAGLRLRSATRRTFLVQLWGAAGDDALAEPLAALIRHGQAIRHTCLAFTSGPVGTDRLRRAGFTPTREAPTGADGRPALTAWEHPA